MESSFTSQYDATLGLWNFQSSMILSSMCSASMSDLPGNFILISWRDERTIPTSSSSFSFMALLTAAVSSCNRQWLHVSTIYHIKSQTNSFLVLERSTDTMTSFTCLKLFSDDHVGTQLVQFLVYIRSCHIIDLISRHEWTIGYSLTKSSSVI